MKVTSTCKGVASPLAAEISCADGSRIPQYWLVPTCSGGSCIAAYCSLPSSTNKQPGGIRLVVIELVHALEDSSSS